MYKHYISVDDNKNVVDVFCSVFKKPEDSDILIKETTIRHAPHYKLRSIDDCRIFCYKYNKSLNDGKSYDCIVRKSDSESEHEKKKLEEDSKSERINSKTLEDYKFDKRSQVNQICTQKILEKYSLTVQNSVILGVSKYLHISKEEMKSYIEEQIVKSDKINKQIDSLKTAEEVIDYKIDFDSV